MLRQVVYPSTRRSVSLLDYYVVHQRLNQNFIATAARLQAPSPHQPALQQPRLHCCYQRQHLDHLVKASLDWCALVAPLPWILPRCCCYCRPFTIVVVVVCFLRWSSLAAAVALQKGVFLTDYSDHYYENYNLLQFYQYYEQHFWRVLLLFRSWLDAHVIRPHVVVITFLEQKALV